MFFIKKMKRGVFGAALVALLVGCGGGAGTDTEGSNAQTNGGTTAQTGNSGDSSDTSDNATTPIPPDEIPVSLKLGAERYDVVRNGHYRNKKEGFVYSPESINLFLRACFKDGHCDDVLGDAKFKIRGDIRRGVHINRKAQKLIAYKEGNYTITARYKGVVSNTITVRIENLRKDHTPLYAQVLSRDKRDTPGRGSKVAFFLSQAPKADLIVPLRLDADAKVRFQANKGLEYNLTVSPTTSSWFAPHFVYIEDPKRDTNDTTPYILHTGAIVSQDSAYNGYDPEDITITPTERFTIFAPSTRQRKGAIRGVRIAMQIVATQIGLNFTLKEAPEGMRLARCHPHVEDALEAYEGKSCRTLVWDVPMDIEENRRYKVTIEATNPDKHKEQTVFYVKVPKTTPIKTELRHNELIVTDKRSPLYGMKLKGHNGEDVSKVRLRSVRYEDVWKAKGKGTHTVFIIYNKPPKLDIDLPGDLKNGLYRFAGSWSLRMSGEAWKSIAPSYLIDAKDAWDEKTGRYIIPKNAKKIPQRNEYDDGGNKIYLLYGEKR